MKQATKASTYFTAEDICTSSLGDEIWSIFSDALEQIDVNKVTCDMETRYEEAEAALMGNITVMKNLNNIRQNYSKV